MKTNRTLAPAGVTVKMRDIVAGINRVSRGEAVLIQYQEKLRRYLGVHHAFFVNSGRTALAVILETLKELSGSREVVIPAYTCLSVPSAIVRAGLKVRLCDISLDTLDLDIAALEKASDEKVLCVIPSNLFGLVSNLPEITQIARRYGIFVIDDAAQSFGASLQGVKSGTTGDAGIFSLGRGKNITTYEGGVIVTNSGRIAQRLIRHPLLRTRQLRKWPQFHSLLGLLGYSVFLHPRLYWVPSSLPFLKLGESKFDPDFEMEDFSQFQCGLGMLMLQRLDQLNKQRAQNALYLYEGLKDNAHVIMPSPLQGSSPVYLRFPIVILDQSLRENIYQGLLQRKIGVTKMYHTAIHRISGIHPYLTNGTEQFSNADRLASSILTLPTHPIVTKMDLDLMLEVIKRWTH